ncbi:MAG: EF-hand domain-containing protein [Gemmataceae bacterium]
MFRYLSVLSLASAFVFAGAVRADEDGAKGKKRNPEKIFKKLDTNKDGKLSLDEFKGIANLGKGKLKDKPELIERVFKKMDADGDGFVTLEEFKKFRQDHAKKKKENTQEKN